jgi:hypothetical protein
MPRRGLPWRRLGWRWAPVALLVPNVHADGAHGLASRSYAASIGCQRATALLMMRITVRDEIVAR